MGRKSSDEHGVLARNERRLFEHLPTSGSFQNIPGTESARWHTFFRHSFQNE